MLWWEKWEDWEGWVVLVGWVVFEGWVVLEGRADLELWDEDANTIKIKNRIIFSY